MPTGDKQVPMCRLCKKSSKNNQIYAPGVSICGSCKRLLRETILELEFNRRDYPARIRRLENKIFKY